ncbi:MAG TPA: M28 family peptidase [Vicinamibacterales bacterium]|nr:M28 family peptidase [Vicinamibacterales bacterium]
MHRGTYAVAGALIAVSLAVGSAASGQNPDGTRARAAAAGPAEPPHQRSTELGWHLAAPEQKYAAIDGAHLKQYVGELTAMSRRYRDNGHPQFWGRIIGTSADTENAEWLMQKFRQIGLTDVHEQYFDLPPQWMPKSWSVTLTVGGKTLSIDTAQPTYQAVATPAGGLDLEAVYVGMASDADLKLARDVRGKAVFFYSTDTASRHAPVADNAIRRIGERGAAAIVIIQGIPGNERTQFYPVNSPVPTFSTGMKDGLAARDAIADATAGGAPPHVRIVLDVDRVPNLKSGTAWATLPGTTDEQVMVVAHRDGWFEGANDNAAGVATMLGLAEYFAKVPKDQRRRTIVFLGTTGHHNSTAESGAWFAAHPEVFDKTAVLLNCEHTGGIETGPGNIRQSNAVAAFSWYGTGARLADIVARAMDAFGVPSFPQSSPSPPGEIGRYYRFAPSVEIINGGYVWHSDQETAETISASGLAAVTRAYAKVIADTDTIPLAEMRQPIAPRTSSQQ